MRKEILIVDIHLYILELFAECVVPVEKVVTVLEVEVVHVIIVVVVV